MVSDAAAPDCGGFTLIEIIVVISLITLMLVFSFPRLSGFLSVNNTNKLVRWMIVQRTVLKTAAVKTQTPYALRLDIGGNRLLTMPVSDSAVFEEETAPSPGKSAPGRESRRKFVCTGDLSITGVMLPDGEILNSGTVDVIFHEKGYCDRAIIHMRDGDERFSIYIEPFLPRVSLYAGHIRFGRQWEEMI